MGFLKKSKDPDQALQETKTPYVVAIEHLLMDITPEAPSGEKDLSGDPAFIDLGIAIQGTPERELGGKIVQEAKPPNWPEIQNAAFELLTRTHDLRVAMFLMRAMLNIKGVAGLYTGLELLGGFIERYWDTLFPRIDPQDKDNPIERINILSALSEGHDILDPLMNATLCSPQPMVRISLRDIHVATGKIVVKDQEKQSAPSLAMIEKAFKDCDVKELQTTKDAINESIISLKHLYTVLEARVGSDKTLDIDNLTKMLEEMGAFFEKQLPDRGLSKLSRLKRKWADQKSDDAGMNQPVNPVSTPTDKPMEPINSRKDVIRVLDQICSYYDQNEPASPVPLLLKRARKLVEKNFIEIVEDLVPDSAAQIKKLIGGVTEE
jgi:type VI secretion system protein ImpA